MSLYTIACKRFKTLAIAIWQIFFYKNKRFYSYKCDICSRGIHADVLKLSEICVVGYKCYKYQLAVETHLIVFTDHGTLNNLHPPPPPPPPPPKKKIQQFCILLRSLRCSLSCDCCFAYDNNMKMFLPFSQSLIFQYYFLHHRKTFTRRTSPPAFALWMNSKSHSNLMTHPFEKLGCHSFP